MNRSELLTHLRSQEKNVPDLPCRIVPTSFDDSDAQLTALPRPLDWKWSSLHEALKLVEPKVAMTRLPLFWQMTSAIRGACKEAGSTLLPNEQENMHGGAAALLVANVNVVVTSSEDAGIFTSYLLEGASTLPEMWLIVHDASAPVWEIPASMQNLRAPIAQDVHLFPGLPLFVQCRHLMRAKKPHYHLAEGCSLDNLSPCIVSIQDSAVTLPALETEFSVQQTGSCECGILLYEKI